MERWLLGILLLGCTSVRVVDDDGEGGGSSSVTPPTSGGSAPSGGWANGGAGASGGASVSGGASPIGGGGPTECTPGATESCYEGAPETNGVGSCSAGARECVPDGSGFGPCLGQVLPDASDDCQTAADEDCDGFAIASCDGFFPMPPNASNFGWQTLQDRFVKEGVPCHAEVTVAIYDHATCYAGSDDRLYCAGYLFGMDPESPYVDMGLDGPLQILMGPSIAIPFDYGNGVCALLRDGTLMCQGLNELGQFGLGHSEPVDTFAAWGGRDDILRVATGNFEQICALTTSGEVLCAGDGFGTTPVVVGVGTKVWVDTDGGVHLDESSIRRVSAPTSECTIDGNGVFDCPMLTVPLQVPDITDGGHRENEMCYLQATGAVDCIHLVILSKETIPRFQGGSVLALATHHGTSTVCAVYDDGSLWCMGWNNEGQLGFPGPPYNLQVETQVRPPGSVRTACQ